MISIVTSYYNRKPLFVRTLNTIKNSIIKDVEFIVVDDGSDPEHRLEGLESQFPFLKIIRIEKENKWYINPCVPFNIGIRETKGDKIILQNPECLHVHDVLACVDKDLNDSNYISMSCYGVDSQQNVRISYHRQNNSLPEFLKTLPQQRYVGYDTPGWYNHSIYRPLHFHFCSAITRNNMAKINGFDERFAMGIGYDDDEITLRIKMLELQMIIRDDVSVIHQYHSSLWEYPNAAELCEKNRLLVDKVWIERNPHANTIPLWNGN